MLSPLAPDAEVFRLVSNTDEHFPPDAPKPHPEAFQLTSADRTEGVARGMPPMLSVFDRARTSLSEGRAIRAAQAAASGRFSVATTPFAWLVSSITSIALPDETPRLEVLADPLEPPCPGSEGHAGIVGLDGVAGEQNSRNKRKLLRSKLVDACYRIAEP